MWVDPAASLAIDDGQQGSSADEYPQAPYARPVGQIAHDRSLQTAAWTARFSTHPEQA